MENTNKADLVMAADGREELRRLAEAATPGAWKLHEVVDRSIRHFCPVDEDGLSLLTVVHQDDTPFGAVYQDADADFIAAANPARILALLETVESQRAVIAGMEAARLAYACGFLLDANGDPDVCGIRKYICALKGKFATPASPASAPEASERAQSLESELLMNDPAHRKQFDLPSERMTTDQAREYLVTFMEQHFSDKTFHRYIMAGGHPYPLAGDFAWQMATALRCLAAPLPPVVERKDGV